MRRFDCFYPFLRPFRDEQTSKRGYFSHLAADCNHGILNGYAPEYVRQSFSKCCISFDSYIKPQPLNISRRWGKCCISFDSYTKPQPSVCSNAQPCSCISFDSYIKPQRLEDVATQLCVVYLLIPTSNHNISIVVQVRNMLYIF